MPINLIITFEVKPESLNSFLSLMDSVKTELPKAEGCLSVDIYQNMEMSIFTLVEKWTSAELHQKHLTKVVASGDWNVIRSYLKADPVSGYFKKI